MNLVTLSLLFTGVLGAVSQRCAGFEDSKKPRQLTVKVGSDTSVLLYHIADVASSNIPMVIDNQVLQLEPNGFGICTEKKVSEGQCDSVGTFIVRFDNTHHYLINKFAHAGEKVDLTISQEGVYCAVTYQEGKKLSHIKLVEKHSYGYLPLPLHETLKVFYLLVALLILTLFAFMYGFKDERGAIIGAIYQDISFLIKAKTTQILWKILVLSIQNRFGTKYVDLEVLVDTIYRELSFMFCYNWSAGIFAPEKEEKEKIKFQPFFKRYLFLMISVVSLLNHHPIPHKLLPLQLSAYSGFLSGGILFIWVCMVDIMWKNSKNTHREIVDPVFAKKYKRSRLCLISIPIAVSFVSFGGVIIFMTAMSNGFYLRSGEFGKDMEGNVTTVLEFYLNQNFLFVFFSHFYEFSALFVQWALLFIWKPRSPDITDFEDIHCKELAEGKGEIKL